MQEENKKPRKSIGKKKIEFAPEFEVSDFCYEFITKVSGIEPIFISNESTLYDFEPDLEPMPKDIEKYWFFKINEKYGEDLYDIREELGNLNIAKICGELERRLEWKKIEKTK